MYIALDGPEGSGKTTVMKRLEILLKERYPKKKILFLKEPGSTKAGQHMRSVLLENELSPLAQLHLFLANRLNIQEVYDFNDYDLVISDRSVYSSIAYQSIGGPSMYQIYSMHYEIMPSLIPDLGLIFKLDAETGLKRKSIDNEMNVFEKKGIDYHRKVSDNFDDILETLLNTEEIDANQEVDDIVEDVIAIIESNFLTAMPRSLPPLSLPCSQSESVGGR